MVKDIGIALDVAKEAGLELPISQHGADIWREIEAAEGGFSSVSRMIAGMEQRAAVQLTAGSVPRARQ
jgi:3-hydroxyisobutyrate dehydrogenase-like beta-hydroxyacid dehydrogenase